MKNNKEKSGEVKLEHILRSGMPLEMEAYYMISNLKSEANIQWIQPDYSFLTTNEKWQTIERSVDFVCSISICLNHPLPHLQLYFVVECKWVSPRDRIWIFMPDFWPQKDHTFGGHRPSLFQDEGLYKKAQNKFADNHQLPFCVKGVSLSYNQKIKHKTDVGFNTGLHQLRDATHSLAIERFRIFTKTFDPASGIFIIPILYTNADMTILRRNMLEKLDTEKSTESVSLDEITDSTSILLCRTPRNDTLNKNKWKNFYELYRDDLSGFENALPIYRRNRSSYRHMMNFFQTTPTYVSIVQQGNLEKYLLSQIEWIKTILINDKNE